MKKAGYLSVIILCLIFLFSACSKSSGGGGGGGNNTVNCSTVSNKAFAADVFPIIQNSCALAGCHAAGSTNGPGPLTNYNQVFNARFGIRSAVQSGIMPQGSTLATSQKNTIICWIEGGAPDN